jgi:regulator of PEP synthase PpsR (kinase-PPPase family)
MQMWAKEKHEARKTSKFGRSYDEKMRALTFMLQKQKGKA